MYCKRNILFTVFTALILINLTIPSIGNTNQIKIYLKIFLKRNELKITNKDGLYINKNYSHKYKTLIIEKDDNILLCNDKEYNKITLNPRHGTQTTITTKYGDKIYDGCFEISLKKQNIYIINTTSLNSYLKGVVSSELGESFNIETLKAQAVISRSYFFSKKHNIEETGYHVSDVAGLFQAYRGLQYTGPKVNRAVKQTAREILKSHKRDFIPYFHSTCGGLMLTPKEIWEGKPISNNSDIRRYDGSDSKPNCSISPYYKWKVNIEKEDILNALSRHLHKKILNISFHINNRGFLHMVRLYINNGKTIELPGFTFKSYIEKQGISKVRSTRMTIKEEDDQIQFEGKGFGHFVGLCQWGAEFLARKSFSYREILKFYYPHSYITSGNSKQ